MDQARRRLLLSTACCLAASRGAKAFSHGPGSVAVSTLTDTQIAAGFFGFFDTTTDVTKRTWYMSSHSSDWSGWVTGQRLQMTLATANSDGVSFAIDNGAWTAGPGAATFDIFNNGSTSRHFVQIRLTSNSYSGLVKTPHTGTVFTITGANPGVDFGAFGAPVMLTDASFAGAHTVCRTAQTASSLYGANVLPNNKDTFNGTNGAGLADYDDGESIKITAKCSSIWVFTGATRCYYSVDKVSPPTRVTFSPAPNNTQFCSWRQVASGLDETTTHDYQLYIGWFGTDAGVGSPNHTQATLGIRLDSGGSFQTLSATKLVGQYGDSITHGGDGGAGCATCSVDTYTDAGVFGDLGYCSGASGAKAANLQANMATMLGDRGFVPDIAIVAIGENDNGVTAQGAFTTSYTAIINAILANGTNKVACRGTSLGNGARTLDTWISNAVAGVQGSLTGSQQVTFVDTSSWTGIAESAPHPTEAGYITMTNYWQPVLQATGWM